MFGVNREIQIYLGRFIDSVDKNQIFESLQGQSPWKHIGCSFYVTQKCKNKRQGEKNWNYNESDAVMRLMKVDMLFIIVCSSEVNKSPFVIRILIQLEAAKIDTG